MIDEIQRYLDEYKILRGRFSKKDMERIAEHFGGTLTSGGRYMKVKGEEYSIYVDYSDMRLKVRHMTWEHGDDFRFARRY